MCAVAKQYLTEALSQRGYQQIRTGSYMITNSQVVGLLRSPFLLVRMKYIDVPNSTV